LEGVPEHQLKVRTSCCPEKKPFLRMCNPKIGEYVGQVAQKPAKVVTDHVSLT